MVINTPSPGGDLRQLRVTGANRTVTLKGGPLTASGNYVPSPGEEIVVVNNVAAGSTVSGMFAGMPEGAVFSNNFLGSGFPAHITFQGGDGNDIAFRVAVPIETAATLVRDTLTITDVNGGTSNDDLTVSYAGGTYTLTDSGGLAIDVSSIAGAINTGTGDVFLAVARNIQMNAGASIATTSGSIILNADGTAGGQYYGINLVAASITTETGVISLSGQSGDSGFNNRGIQLQGSASISSTGSTGTGDVTVTGIGGTGTNPTGHQGIDITTSSNIQSASGNIVLVGASVGDSWGLVMSAGASVSSSGSANITLTGESAGTGPDIAMGDFLIDSGENDLTINANTIGYGETRGSHGLIGGGDLVVRPGTAATTISLGGGAGTLNLEDSELALVADGFSSITIGDLSAANAARGDVDIDTATFTDPVTIAGKAIQDGVGTDVNAGANTVTLDGIVAPGQSPGVLAVTGNVALADNSIFEVEVGGTSPGTANTNHDQIGATGAVAIGAGVALNLVDFNGFGATLVVGDTIEIINRTGGSGTFDGLPEGATIGNLLGSGLNATISYVGGDGDDVVLEVQPPPPATAIIDNDDPAPGYTSSGNLGNPWTNQAYLNDVREIIGPGKSATYTFGGLTPGDVFDLSVTWTAFVNRETKAPYAVNGASVGPLTFEVDQTKVPDDFADGGVDWERLATLTVDSSGALTVTVSGTTSKSVIADAMRIDRRTDAEIVVEQAETNLVSGSSSVDLGEGLTGATVSTIFRVTNIGAANLNLPATLTLPAGFERGANNTPATLFDGGADLFRVGGRVSDCHQDAAGRGPGDEGRRLVVLGR